MTVAKPRARRWSQVLGQGVRRGPLALLPLALLPGLSGIPAPYRTAAGAAVLLASLILWAVTMVDGSASSRSVALLAPSDEVRGMGAWETCLLALVLAVAVRYIVTGSSLHEILYNDGAYYYGVARHFALTGRFEEPIVWHFINPPASITHAPFDYWGCMTSLLLVPPLVVFGATPETAFVTMSVIAATSLLAFWYLACFALPLRYYATQLLALMLFAFSPAMDVYRFQPESIAIAQLFLLLSLIAFCRRRFVLAILCAFGILLARGDGLILFSLIFLAVVLEEARGAGKGLRLRRVILVALACIGTYMLWSFISFGTPTPPGPQTVPLLPRFFDVYDFGAVPVRSGHEIVSHWFRYDYVSTQMMFAFVVLILIPFVPAAGWWLTIAIAGVFDLFRHRAVMPRLIWLLCFAGYFLVAWVGGPGFVPFRTPHGFTTLIVLAGAVGVDTILGWLDALVERGRYRRVRAVVVGAGVLALCAFFLSRVPVFQGYPTPPNLPYQHDLTRLDQVLGGEPVASNVPWYIIAYTQGPSVSIPFNGEAAIEAVLERYHIRWLVIAGNPPLWHTGRSLDTLRDVLAGKRTDVGRFRLEHVPIDVPADRLNVYRVQSTS
jgi:hypothetical protein